jgi:hypothetical protein
MSVTNQEADPSRAADEAPAERARVAEREQEQLRARAFGFASLFAWGCLGLALEAAHGFKLAPYLDHPRRRELLVLAHAHGLGLALVVLAYASQGLCDARAARAGGRLRFAACALPLGFALGVIGAGESDPGPAIWLVPLAALVLLTALLEIALGARRARR